MELKRKFLQVGRAGDKSKIEITWIKDGRDILKSSIYIYIYI